MNSTPIIESIQKVYEISKKWYNIRQLRKVNKKTPTCIYEEALERAKKIEASEQLCNELNEELLHKIISQEIKNCFKISDSLEYGIIKTSLKNNQCWSIKQTNIPSTWIVTKGEDITAMVIDTGHTDHKDIGDNAIPGKVFVFDNSIDINDKNGHGTHVTGIICAKNYDSGVVGIAPKCKVITVKALNDRGSGSMVGIENALEYALEVKPNIICMSLGAPQGSHRLHSLIKKLYSMNIPIVCAAGNNGNVGGVNYPAAYDETISIGAFDKNGNIADFSATGPQVDWSAPGVSIYSTWLNNSYLKIDGTSMAAPYIVGVITLLLSKHKMQEELTGQNDCHTVEQIREHLLKYTIDKGIIGKDNYWGYGIIDVERLILGHVSCAETINNYKQKKKWYKRMFKYFYLKKKRN